MAGNGNYIAKLVHKNGSEYFMYNTDSAFTSGVLNKTNGNWKSIIAANDLDKVYVGNQCTDIAAHAFESSHLTYADMTKAFNVLTLRDQTFKDCLYLHTFIGSEDTSGGEFTILQNALLNRTNLTYIKFPYRLVSLGQAAIAGLSKIEYLYFPDGFQTINGHMAMVNNRKLKHISMPDDVVLSGGAIFGSTNRDKLPNGGVFYGSQEMFTTAKNYNFDNITNPLLSWSRQDRSAWDVSVNGAYWTGDSGADVGTEVGTAVSPDSGDSEITSVPCFLENTKILTSSGYKPIQELIAGYDKLVDDKGKEVALLEVQLFNKPYNGKEFPRVVPKGACLGNGIVCTEDLYMTHNHCIYNPSTNMFIPPNMMKIPEDRSIVQSYKYYHAFTANYFTDVIIANGIPCESHSKYISKTIKKIDSSGKFLKNALKACQAKPNGMRVRLTQKEFG